ISASLSTPAVFVSAIASALIMTVGILFITDDKIAAINPVPIVATNMPCCATVSNTLASMLVSPTFLRPYTTTYIPIEKNTIAQGAPFNTVIVSTAELLLAINKNRIATIPAIIDTGISMNSLVKYPINRMANTNQDKRNNFLSRIAS